jgi:hypothetical protein
MGRGDHDLAFEQLVPPPPLSWTAELLDTCEELYQTQIVPGDARLLGSEQLRGIPVWIFLEFLTKQRGLLVHGSNRADIDIFEPRVAGDTFAGGEVPKVYATSSGIAALFYAILDRKRLWELPCVPAMTVIYAPWVEHGHRREGFWFTVDHRALPYAPWRAGTVYVLPHGSFTADYQEVQWYSLTAVRPMARLRVMPEDFPLLHEVRGIDWFEDARRRLTGAPFRDDPLLYPAQAHRSSEGEPNSGAT